MHLNIKRALYPEVAMLPRLFEVYLLIIHRHKLSVKIIFLRKKKMSGICINI